MNELEKTTELVNEEIQRNAGGSGRTKYLIFSLGEEDYGIPLNAVKEVVGLSAITSLPYVPKYFRGLINLRGMIISVVDLRLKLGLPETEYIAKKTCVIIVEVSGMTVGVVVDNVSEVANFSETQIESNIETGASVSNSYIVGVARRESDKLTILLEISSVMTGKDLDMIRRSVQSGVKAA